MSAYVTFAPGIAEAVRRGANEACAVRFCYHCRLDRPLEGMHEHRTRQGNLVRICAGCYATWKHNERAARIRAAALRAKAVR